MGADVLDPLFLVRIGGLLLYFLVPSAHFLCFLSPLFVSHPRSFLTPLLLGSRVNRTPPFFCIQFRSSYERTDIVNLSPDMDRVIQMAAPVQMAMATATPVNPFPFQKTKADLDWAVFMYIFVFASFIGSVLLYRIFTCCVERSSKDVMV